MTNIRLSLGLRPNLYLKIKKQKQIQSYQDASRENSYLFGVTPFKYVRHMAKFAPVGRSGATPLPAAFPLYSAAAAVSE